MYILLYAGLLFVGTFSVSFLFGFVKEFQKARRNPFSEQAVEIMKYLEWALEASFVIGITVYMSVRDLEHLFEKALFAYTLATIISYLLDVKIFHGTFREFWCRTVISYFVCLPIALLIVPYVANGT